MKAKLNRSSKSTKAPLAGEQGVSVTHVAVRPPKTLFAENLLGETVAMHPAIQDDDLRGVVAGGCQVVGDHGNRSTGLGLVALEQIVEVALRQEIDTGGGLVEQHDRRPPNQGAGQEDALQFTAGEAGQGAVEQMTCPDPLQGRGSLLAFRPRHPGRPGSPQARHNQLEGYGWEGPVEGLELGNVADARGGAKGILSANCRVTFSGPDQAEGDFEQGRFPSTVGTHHYEKLTALQVEGHILENVGLPEPHRNVVDVERGWVHYGYLPRAPASTRAL